MKCDHSLNIANLALFLLKQIYMGQPSSHVVRTARDEIINRFREGASLRIKRGFLFFLFFFGGGGGLRVKRFGELYRTVRTSGKIVATPPKGSLLIIFYILRVFVEFCFVCFVSFFYCIFLLIMHYRR